jgi:hypothetical protein
MGQQYALDVIDFGLGRYIIYAPHYNMIHIKKYKVLSSTENTTLKL